MLTDTIQLISRGISSNQLEKTLKKVISHHRIQASPGFHEAAEDCIHRLQSVGIDAKICFYPAREGVFFQNSPSFEAWECKNAWCICTQTGEKLADYRTNPISLIQKSASWLQPDMELEVVDLNRGNSESAYKEIDFNGKVVLVHTEFAYVRDWVIEKRGAVGYISDYIAPEPPFTDSSDLNAVRKYTSFWWRPGQKRVFGFVITPEQGRRLSGLCSEAAKKGQAVTVKCLVDSKLSNGMLEIVNAVLPGKSQEEILLVAHLCHPLPSANDNASGTTAALEALCALKQLLNENKLPPLQRSIRLLLVPEIIGSYAYLNGLTTTERKKIRLALTLDMVGGKQDGNRGPLTLYETPHSTPSIANHLAGFIFQQLNQILPALNSVDSFSMFHTTVCEFIDGSDHGLFNDPACGIPSPLLCQWPDKYYHTDHDTFEQIDFNMIHLACTLAASYAYIASTLNTNDLSFLILYGKQRMIHNLSVVINEYLRGETSALYMKHLLKHYEDYYVASLRDYETYLPLAEREIYHPLIQKEVKQIRELILHFVSGLLPDKKSDTVFPEIYTAPQYQYIPKRTFWGKMDYGFGWYASRPEGFPELSQYKKFTANCDLGDFEALTIYYINGKNTLAQIAENVLYDVRGKAEDICYIDAYVRLLKAAGLVSFEE